jgi:subtilase family serine protease
MKFFSLCPRLFHFERALWAGRNAASGRRAGRFACRPALAALEKRLALSGNIAAFHAFAANADDQPLTTISAGEAIGIVVNFTTQGLPSDASYGVSFTMNGLTQQGKPLSFGAGSPDMLFWHAGYGYFLASPGENQVTVTVDPDDTVPETSYADNSTSFTFDAALSSVPRLSYTVSQVRAAYGIDRIPNFGALPADGRGQTIAIVDLFDDPSIFIDADGFDQAMHLTTNSSPTLAQANGPASSWLKVYNQSGKNITARIASPGAKGVPRVDPTGGWEAEETLDVEWAHAIAPGAKIDLIEGNGNGGDASLFKSTSAAAKLRGVTVVSMSWGSAEMAGSKSRGKAELSDDSRIFVTPRGNPGITFLASSGDFGIPGIYPAYSPNVVAVGGTELITNGDAYGSETGWGFPTPRTLNNGSDSYSQSGTWTSTSGGFSGTYSTATAGSDSSAEWTTSIAPKDRGSFGGTEVSATWVANVGNATNATYLIYDGAGTSGALLGKVTVDQTKAPEGTSDGSSQFQGLGNYHPESGMLTVVLQANSANGSVVADAVGISPTWASGGGESRFEPEPKYQRPFQATGHRTTPDVSFDASINSGVTVYQNGQFHVDYFGTSAAAPSWAGLFAIVNQGRVARGGKPLNSGGKPMQAVQALYRLPASAFHDITSGYNGTSAGPGYDQVTGRGSPVANLLVPDLVS